MTTPRPGLTLNAMRRVHLTTLLVAWAVLAAWPGAWPVRGDLDDLVEKLRRRRVILTYDLLAEPGKTVTLRASLRTGTRFDGVEEKRLRFYLDSRLLGERITDDDGDATVAFTMPPKPGDYRVRVSLHPDDQPVKPVQDATLLVAVRKADAPIAIVDIDKTVVADNFGEVLLGTADPMPGSAHVLRRLAARHTIVYLTHRPDFLGPHSKRWLHSHNFPRGPVLTGTLGGLIDGSGSFKAQRLADLRRTFQNISWGIGDKLSDARAYARNGVRSILILHVDWTEDDAEDYEEVAGELAALPASVQIVQRWDQIAGILFDGKSYPRDRMLRRLRERARMLRREEEEDEGEDDDVNWI